IGGIDDRDPLAQALRILPAVEFDDTRIRRHTAGEHECEEVGALPALDGDERDLARIRLDVRGLEWAHCDSTGGERRYGGQFLCGHEASPLEGFSDEYVESESTVWRAACQSRPAMPRALAASMRCACSSSSRRATATSSIASAVRSISSDVSDGS